jgi:multidrug efflux system outer membrane protein
MTKRVLNGLSVGMALALLGGCGALEPRYSQPKLPVVDAWPIAPIAASAAPAAAGADAAPGPALAPTDTASAVAPLAVADMGWREFFVDEPLQQLIALALDNNRDLRVAVLNIDKARAQYQQQRSARLPSVNATGALSKQKSYTPLRSAGTDYPTSEVYSADLGVAAFELDLFGRVQSLSRSARQQYLATAEARRAAQLSLIAEVANLYLTLAADRELQQLATETLRNQEESFRLTQQKYQLGAVSGLDLAQAQTTVASARVDAARYDGNVAQDLNALVPLLGTMPDAALLPARLDHVVTGLAPLPAGLPSAVLLRRPDVLQAEHVLRSANASIGAARAAFLPAISLTGSFGTASDELGGLFKAGNATWSFIPQVTVPIFQGGRLRAGLGVASAEREIAVARYEKAIQAGFSEVADALALTQTLARQRQAQEQLAAATGRAYQLADERYRAGRDSYFTLLDAQRSDYAARQGLIATRRAEQSNRVTLYKVLGGGWREHSQ